MAERVAVEGFGDLDKALADLPRATRKNVARRGLIKAAQPIADAGRRNAPKLEGFLQDSYAVGTKLTRSQRKQHRRRDPVEVYVGPTDPAGLQTEFGNEHQPAQPHLRPAWDQEAKPTLGRIRTFLEGEIGKAVARAERKALRAASKAGR